MDWGTWARIVLQGVLTFFILALLVMSAVAVASVIRKGMREK